MVSRSSSVANDSLLASDTSFVIVAKAACTTADTRTTVPSGCPGARPAQLEAGGMFSSAKRKNSPATLNQVASRLRKATIPSKSLVKADTVESAGP
jgi:hypothetical protein